MVKNDIDYFYITLSNGQNSIIVGEKSIPIIGVFLSNNALHEILTGKKISENLKGKKLDKLSYIALNKVPNTEVKKLEEFVFGLTIKEKMAFTEQIKLLEENLEDEKFLETSFGLGDKMTKRLIVNAKRSKESEQKG